MILRSLRFASIGQPFKGKEVTMDFSSLPPGVYAFVGSNGEGKSTVLELLLPGALYRWFPSYREAIVKKATTRQTFVELEFSAGGQRHKVVVQCDPKAGASGKTEAYWYTWCWAMAAGLREEAEVHDDPPPGWVPCAGPLLKDFDAYRDKFFPSLELLLAGPFCAQKVTRGNGSFFAADPADRKALFVEALGLGRLQELSEQYGKQVALKQREVIRLDGELAGLRSDGIEPLENQRDHAGVKRDGAINDVELTQDAAARALSILTNLRAAHAEHEREQARVKEQERQRAEEAKALLLEGGRIDRLLATRSKAPTLEKLEEAKRAEDAAGALIVTRRTELIAASDASETSSAYFNGLVRERDRAGTRLKALRPLAAALDGVDLSLEICQRCPLTQEAKPAVPEVQRLTAEFEAHQATIAEAETSTQGATQAMRAAHDALRESEARAKAYTGEVAEMARLMAAIPADLDDQVTAYQERKARSETPVLNGGGMEPPRPLAEVEKAAQQADLALKQARTRLETAQRELQDIETRLRMAEEAQARRAQLTANRGELVEEVAALELLAAGLGPKGLQAVYIDQAGPTVECLTNDLLHQTFGPRFSIAFDTRRLKVGKKPSDPDAYSEVFDLRVIDAWASEQRAQGSGGETTWFDTAFRLALSIYVTRSTGKDLRTLAFDEPSGQLSAEYAPQFTAMLKAARVIGGFDKVLLVSHQREVWGACDGFWVFRDGAVTYCDDVEGVDALLKAEAR